jgi:hypothetical protein
VDRYLTALFHRDFSHYRNAVIKETGENSVMWSFITSSFHEMLMLKQASYYIVQTYGGMEVWLHPFLIVLD